MAKYRLYYVHDPMCSWCWGYKPTLLELEQILPSNIELVYLLGGLAPDSDLEMPAEMQAFLQQTWRKIANQLGTQFNYQFWELNTPRRSTYPANRAVLAAKQQGAEKAMIVAIQQAYYLDAKNPSDLSVLIDLAEGLNLDLESFKTGISSEKLNANLLEEIEFARSLPIQGFPSLVLEKDGHFHSVGLNYKDAQASLEHIQQLLA
ncbi:DsbA family protein [Agarivorans sp. B2Z047]|uniref:DsbA family protein n=1 Tax=Agarivorans sp. B2Z047 TaxID=2652721 RepID=UPI00128C4B72|nr:DsbA family protein [Agarivorans sp. B2Z047]MPW29701.1 DsbA family protein [Agarivorans sp. B2Z047]UQN40654.1 DsbA family protein [Agarivorans sp. B2Z047]